MPYWPPDTPPPPEGVPQMPQAGTPGPAPVPYGGAGWALDPGHLAPLPDVPMTPTAGGHVMAGTAGADHVSELPLAAPNVNPYEAGAPSPIDCGLPHMGAGSCDDVAGSVAAAVAAAEARAGMRQAETYGQGSVIGDLMQMPPSHLDPAASSPGTTDPAGSYYDPPRDYGG